MTKFEMNGVSKQEQAYNINWATKQFNFSCERCCSQGLRHTRCDVCPIQCAHNKALKEIREGKRQRQQSKDTATFKVVVKGNVYITRTLIINNKEDK